MCLSSFLVFFAVYCGDCVRFPLADTILLLNVIVNKKSCYPKGGDSRTAAELSPPSALSAIRGVSALCPVRCLSVCLWRVSTVYVIGGHLHLVQPRQTVTQMVSLHHILNSYIPLDNKLRNHHPLDHHFPAKIIVRRFRRSGRARKIEAAKVTILENISSRVNLQKCLQRLDIHTNLISFC